MVSGTYVIGIEHTELAKFSASLDLTCITHITYMKRSATLSDEVNETSWDGMKKAVLEEKRLFCNLI